MPFTPGQSGNPKGRPRGTGRTEKLRRAIEKDLPAIIAALACAAKDGDTGAAKLLLDRVIPTMRPVDKPAPVALSPELGQAGRDILEAIGDGRLTPDEGAKLLQAAGALSRIIETDELTKRIEALEQTTEQHK